MPEPLFNKFAGAADFFLIVLTCKNVFLFFLIQDNFVLKKDLILFFQLWLLNKAPFYEIFKNIFIERLQWLLSVTGNIKIYQCHVIKSYYPQWKSTLSTSITEMFLLPKFDSSSPSVTQDKEICLLIMS